MRLGSLASARPAAFDRNPVQTIKQYAAFSVAPHVYTTRWTYTVPAGKRAVMTSAHMWSQLYIAATVVGQRQGDISIAPLGVSQTAVINYYDTDNTANRQIQTYLSQGPLLNATDVITAQTRDSSTGGAVNLSMSATFTEFDA